MKILVIGDVHGLLQKYQKILKTQEHDLSIQVGDFGFKDEHIWHTHQANSKRDKVNFGNHDYYPMLGAAHSLGNHSFISEVAGEMASIFTIRGAYSIDKKYRREGRDWFPNEELNAEEADAALTEYKLRRPQIVVSHDGPFEVVDKWFIQKHPYWIPGSEYTRKLLQAMFEAHQPQQWFFGHHHESMSETIKGTAFRCLAETEYAWVL